VFCLIQCTTNAKFDNHYGIVILFGKKWQHQHWRFGTKRFFETEKIRGELKGGIKSPLTFSIRHV
jgi:hypothetical protein